MASKVDGTIKLSLGVDVDTAGVDANIKRLSDALAKNVRGAAKEAGTYLNQLWKNIDKVSRDTREKLLKGYTPAYEALGAGEANQPKQQKQQAAPTDSLKVDAEAVTAFVSEVANGLASEVIPRFQEITGILKEQESVASGIYDSIMQWVGGAENFASILTNMQFGSMEDLGGYLGDFAGNVVDTTFKELNSMPITNPARLLGEGLDMAQVRAAFLSDIAEMQGGADVFAQHIAQIIEPMKQLPAVISEMPQIDFRSAAIDEQTEKYRAFYESVKLTMNDVVQELQKYQDAVNTYSSADSWADIPLAFEDASKNLSALIPQVNAFIDAFNELVAAGYNLEDINAILGVDDANEAMKDLVSNYSLLVDASNRVREAEKGLDMRDAVTEAEKLAKMREAEAKRQRDIANLKITPAGVEIVDKEAYQRGLQAKQVLADIANYQKAIATSQEELAAAQAQFAGMEMGTKPFADMETQIELRKQGIEELTQALNEAVAAYKNLMGSDAKIPGIEEAAKEAPKMVSSFQVAGNAVSRLFPGIGGQVGSIISNIGNLKDANAELAKSASATANSTTAAFGQMSAGMGAKINAIVGIISASIKIIKTLFNKAQQAGHQFVQGIISAFNKLKSAVSSMASRFSAFLKSTTSGFHKSHNLSFKKMLSMVLKYGIGIRSVYMLFRKLRTMVTENFVFMAKQADRFNKAMSNLQSSFGQFKGQLSAAVEPLITAFAPVLIRIIELLTAAALAVTRFFGALAGFGKVLKATKVTKDFAAGAGSANKQLAQFDMLQNLTTGGGGGGKEASSGWEWVDAEIPDWWKQILEMWDAADFSDLGRKLADKISKALNSIKWDEIFAISDKIGKSIATFLNGLFTNAEKEVDPKLFSSIARTISNGLNTVLHAVDSFLVNFDFTNFGKAISLGINSLVNAFDFKLLIKTAADGGKGLADTVNGIFNNPNILQNIGSGAANIVNAITAFLKNITTNIQWADAGKNLGKGFDTFLKSIDIQSVKEGLVGLFDGLGDFITSVIENIDFNTAIQDLTQLLKDGIQSLGKNLGRILTSITENIDPEELGKAINEIGTTLMEELSKLAESEELRSWVTTLFDNIDLSGLVESFTGMMMDFVKLIPVGDIWIAMKSAMFGEAGIGALIFGEISESLGGLTFFEQGRQLGETIREGISEKITTIAAELPGKLDEWKTTLSTKFGEMRDAIAEKTGEWKSNITNKLGEIKQNLGNDWTEISGNISTKFGEMRDTITDKVGEWKSNISDKLGLTKTDMQGKWTEISADVSTFFGNMRDDIKTKVDEWKSNISEKLADIKGDMATKWGDIKLDLTTKFNDMKQAIATSLSDWKTNIGTGLQNIFSNFSTTFTNIKNTVIDILTKLWEGIKKPLNAILGGVESLANGMIGGLNGAIDALNALSFTVPSWVPLIGGSSFSLGIPSLATVSLPRLAQGAVIPPNKEFMAVLGDQKHGTNIETPLDTMLEAFNMALAQQDNGEQIALMQAMVELLQEIAAKEFGIDGSDVFNSVRNSARSFQKSTGRNAFSF